MAAMGTVLTNKYAEGYPGRRYYGGCQEVDVVEEIARQRACTPVRCRTRECPAPFGCPGQSGGVFRPARAGRYRPRHEPRSRRPSDPRLSGEFLRKAVQLHPLWRRSQKPVLSIMTRCAPWPSSISPLIVAGASAYPREIRFDLLRQIADAAGAKLMVDMAHIAGLVAAGNHMNPVPYCRGGHHHHPQDPAGPARRSDPLPGGIRQGH